MGVRQHPWEMLGKMVFACGLNLSFVLILVFMLKPTFVVLQEASSKICKTLFFKRTK